MDFLRFTGPLLILLICFSKQSYADLFSATQHYQLQNYSLAHDEFIELSQFGNTDAMYNLAVMSLHGQGTTKSLPRAYAWFLLASDFGLTDAKQTAELIKQQYPDKQVLEDMYLALKHQYGFEVISKQFYPSSFKKSKQNLTKVKDHQPNYPEQAIRQGVEGWVWVEFDIDDSGAVTDISLIAAHPKHIFSTELINAVSLWRYDTTTPIQNRSLTYHFTTFKGKQYRTAFQNQRKQYKQSISEHIDAAEQGNSEVQFYISQWLQSSEYNASKLLRYHWQDEQAAQSLLFASAKNNFPLAQYKLAVSLLNNDNHDPDRQIAMNWLKVAAKQNSIPALYRLGTVLADNQSPEYSPNRALDYFKRAAELGHFRAIKEMCLLLQTIPSQEEKSKRCIDTGLSIDDAHPTLLLLKAKSASNKTLSLKYAKQALDSAQDRNWSTKAIKTFIDAL